MPPVNLSPAGAGSGFGTALQGIIGSAVEGGLGFLSTLGQIDLFKRAQSAGLTPGAATPAAAPPPATPTKSGLGLPLWAIPAGIGVIGLVILVLLFRK